MILLVSTEAQILQYAVSSTAEATNRLTALWRAGTIPLNWQLTREEHISDALKHLTAARERPKRR